MEYKVYDCESYKIHTIKTDKFKNCSMEIIFRDYLSKNRITEYNILVDLLMHSSLKYPKRRDVSIELENLYNSFIRGVVTRIGNCNSISFVMDFLNPKYCDDGFLEEAISFPFEMIQNPNMQMGEFDQRSFKIIKNRIKSDIESLKESAPRYAFRRSLELMDKDSPTSYYMVGYMDDLEAISASSLVNTYKRLLNDFVCDIYIIGNLDMDKVVSIIRKKFKRRSLVCKNIPLYVDNKIRKRKIDVCETGKYEQDSFVMIFNLDNLTVRERCFVIQLYNVILGSGGLTSKLYQYLREQNSLCYSVSSMYQKYDSLLIVYAGIDAKDKDKCVKLVNKAMKEMSNGDFSDEDLDNAKKTIISSIKMSEDSQFGIVNNYLFHELDNLPFYEERIKEFKTVTKDEIMDVAKKVKLNTIYLLRGEEETCKK